VFSPDKDEQGIRQTTYRDSRQKLNTLKTHFNQRGETAAAYQNDTTISTKVPFSFDATILCATCGS
jgi:hypothetical protein